MEKSKMLLVALGQGAGNIVDGLMNKNTNYTGLFLNSSLYDIKPLKNAELGKNTYIYPGVDGSGRDRKKSEEMIKDNANAIGTLLRKYPQTETMVVFTSMAGGTGSGAIKTFIQIAKAALPTVKVNVVAILPSHVEDELSFKNTLDCWNDINSIIDLINDIKFIDNNKRETYKEINTEVVNLLDLSYNMMGIHADGNIDTKDSFKINTAIGSSIVLKLHDGLKDSKAALDLAIESSVFAQPTVYDCDYLGINIKEDGYIARDIARSIEVYNTTYITYNSDFNIVVLSGCETPVESIELIKMSYEDKLRKKALRNKKRGVIITIDPDLEDVEKETKKDEVLSYSDESFDKLFS